MFKVELKEGTDVFTFDGKEVGKISRFVLDPATDEVTHVVIEKGWLLKEDKVVPFDKVRSATEDKVVLSDDVTDLDQFPPFEETHYIRVPGESLSGSYPTKQNAAAYYWYPPYGYNYSLYGIAVYGWPPTVTERNIPENTIPLKEGTDVISSDGKHVGDVERLLLEPGSNKATHFVISQGLFFKERKLVPANWIESATSGEVRLTVSSSFLEQVPAYKES